MTVRRIALIILSSQPCIDWAGVSHPCMGNKRERTCPRIDCSRINADSSERINLKSVPLDGILTDSGTAGGMISIRNLFLEKR